MAKRPNAAKLDRPTPANGGTLLSGEVPVRRTSIALARRFFQICTTAAAETLAETGLTTLQFAVMVSLSSVTGEPGIDQNGLTARLGIDRASTSQLVDELAAMGLVERHVNGADRRARLLRLTPRGERLRARLHPAQIANQARILAALMPEERELLLDLLVRVVESNRALARPGSGRRKRGYRQSSADKSRQSPSTEP